MFSNTTVSQIKEVYDNVCRELIAQQNEHGYWTGRLSDSALATATAVSAFSVYRKARATSNKTDSPAASPLTEAELKKLDTAVSAGVKYLTGSQNTDGGWGDTDKSNSNPATTLLVKSALLLSDEYIPNSERLTKPSSETDGSIHNSIIAGWSMDLLGKADMYFRRKGGIDGLKHVYGNDRSFAAPILANAALAGLVPWRDVPQLPFERAALPMSWYRFVKLHVVSYALPALVSVGMLRLYRYKNRNFVRIIRKTAVKKTLSLIEKMQPESGGYLEAIPLTAFAVMCLAGCTANPKAPISLDNPVIINGLRFLLNTVRDNGSWAIDTNLSTWLTAQSVSALSGHNSTEPDNGFRSDKTLNWLTSCQHKKRHPFTGAAPGGWGWTHLSGAVPDADDTSAALLALATDDSGKYLNVAVDGIRWLLQLVNRDGGVPTFCRGWGMLPFDKSSTDITAHAIRALRKWTPRFTDDSLLRKMKAAEKKMLTFLTKTQRLDGSWVPLWFGNQYERNGENPVYGTAKVLLALDLNTDETVGKHRDMGIQFLLDRQNIDGGWNGGDSDTFSTVEETATAIEALTSFSAREDVAAALERAWEYLLQKIESNEHRAASPIGLYFSQLWYYEDLYPLLFTAAALKKAADV